MYLSLGLSYKLKSPFDSFYIYVSSDWNNIYNQWDNSRWGHFRHFQLKISRSNLTPFVWHLDGLREHQVCNLTVLKLLLATYETPTWPSSTRMRNTRTVNCAASFSNNVVTFPVLCKGYRITDEKDFHWGLSGCPGWWCFGLQVGGAHSLLDSRALCLQGEI